ncbi:MAG: hypothetical protein ACRC14_17550, partial [Paracoccaceae bacterium]
MKPTFALDFRTDAIALLHRSQRGWTLVGEVAIDAPDLAEALGYLRSTALGLSPRGLTTKLVIPNAQVLYTTVRAPAPDATRRRKQVARGLEGVTPYPVADLVYDISGRAPEVQVAVIARETLAEAEAFAAEHRFNPMSFVAVPEDGSFDREAWFGPTELAASLLPEGEEVERDDDPLAMQSRDLPGKSGEPAAATAEPDLPATAPPVIAEPEPEPAPQDAAADPAPEPTVEPEPEHTAPPEPEPVAATAEAPPAVDAGPVTDALLSAEPAAIPADPEQVLTPGFSAPVAAVEATPTAVESTPPELPATEPTPPAPTPAVVDEAPIALDVVDDHPEPVSEPVAPSAGVIDPSIPDDLPPPPASSILMAFASRRAAEVAKEGSGAKTSPKVASKPAAGKAPTLGAATATRTGPPPRVTQITPRKEAGEKPALSVASDTAPTTALPAKEAPKPGTAAKTLRGLGALVTAPSIPGAKQRRPMVQTTPAASPNAAASAAAATLTRPGSKPYSGGLGNRTMVQRGKPRYLGLILTGILLVFLALVAAWSTFFLTRNEATTTDPTAVASNTVDPAVEDEMLADMQDPAELSVIAEEPTEDAAALPEPVEPVAVVAAPEPAPDTQVSTETVAAPGPFSEPQDEIFLSSMDLAPDMPDALSLPRPAAQSDPPPGPAIPPPPFGTVYQFDADGLIVPTPEGILTPEGVLLFAG